jgi:hypothetical protein
MTYKVEFEITGLSMLVPHGRDTKTNVAPYAELLWLKGDWKSVQRHTPVLALDLATIREAAVFGMDTQLVHRRETCECSCGSPAPRPRLLVLFDLTKTDVHFTYGGDAAKGVALDLASRSTHLFSWMDWVTKVAVDDKYLGTGHRGQVQGRVTFDRGSIAAAKPYDDALADVQWKFGDGSRTRQVCDRLVWTYDNTDASPIGLHIIRRDRKQAEAHLELAPEAGKPLYFSATCYPALHRRPDVVPPSGTTIYWDDFPVFYELLRDKVPHKDRVVPKGVSDGRTIKDGWCPGVWTDGDGGEMRRRKARKPATSAKKATKKR